MKEKSFPEPNDDPTLDRPAVDRSYIDRNLTRVRRELARVCIEAGRCPEDVTLLAAVKYATADEVNYLHRAGVTHMGENRVGQLRERYDHLERDGMQLHFIGTLQTNKVKYIIDKVDMVESLDSFALARELQRQAEKHDRTVDVLIEINSGRELSKGGVLPEDVARFAREVVDGYDRLRLRGFMTMAPRGDEATYRRLFGETRRLTEALWDSLPHGDLSRGDLPHGGAPMVLSMGMSDSYLYAAAEGATEVRVGRALFAREDAPDDI